MEKYLSQLVLRTRFLWVALSLATVVTLLLVACGASSGVSTQASPTAQGQASAIVNVKIVEKDGKYVFTPETLTIKVGTPVVRENDTAETHTVTRDTAVFEIDNLAEKQTYKFVFTKPGRYAYYCNVHTYMIGTIIVT